MRVKKEIFPRNSLTPLLRKHGMKYDQAFHTLIMEKDFLLSEHFKTRLLPNLIGILSEARRSEASEGEVPCTESYDITKKLESLSISTLKVKIKSRGQAHPRDQLREEASSKTFVLDNVGFEIPPGYSPAIPIYSNYFPDNSLFLSLKKDEKFLPFFKLISDKNEFFPIRAIGSRSCNQQGVKLGTMKVQDRNRQTKVSVARLKIKSSGGLGILRARGIIFQKVITADKKLCQLYLINELYDKKTEKRKRMV